MERIEIHDLGHRIHEIVRAIREEGKSYELVDQGVIIARLVPLDVPQMDTEQQRTFWQAWDELGERISRRWPADVSATDAIRDDREARS